MTDISERSAPADRDEAPPRPMGEAPADHRRAGISGLTRTSIAQQLRLLLITTALIPILLIGIWGVITSRTDLSAAALEQQSRSADHVAHLFEQFFEESELRLIATTISAEWADLDNERRQVILSRLLAESPAFEELAYVDADGIEQNRVSRTLPTALLELRDRSSERAVTSPLQTGRSFFGPATETEFGSIVEMSVLDTNVETGDASGVLVAILELSRADISAEELHGDQTITAYLLDGDGFVVAHASPSVALRRPALPDSQRMGFRNGLDGQSAVLASAGFSVGDESYLAVAERPASEALGPWAEEIARWMTLLVIALVLAVVMPRLLARSLSEDISVLGEAAVAFGEGRTATRVAIHRNDELGDLATGFNEMADRLASSLNDLERSRAEIADAYRELERFTTATAHDLQEPIRKVQTYGSLLGRSAESLDELGQSRLERLLAASSELAELTRALFDYTQVLRFDEAAEPVHLGELVDWCVARRADELAERGAVVDHVDLSVVHAPPSALALILDELIANAIRFSRDGTPLSVQIWQDAYQGHVRVTVADNGEGFDSRYDERIFEPFERLHAKGVHTGTGMGLAIARRYARAIGGNLTAAGSPAGATFFIDLPHDPHSEDWDTP